MELKKYQERVLNEVRIFLDQLVAQRGAGAKRPSLEAWDETKKSFTLVGNYAERRNGLGDDLPTFCIKVPTGGGKTLLAIRILGLLHETILRARNGTGLVLWVVPSDQIYKDTFAPARPARPVSRIARVRSQSSARSLGKARHLAAHAGPARGQSQCPLAQIAEHESTGPRIAQILPRLGRQHRHALPARRRAGQASGTESTRRQPGNARRRPRWRW